MSDDQKPEDNVVSLKIIGKEPGSRGRAGREHPELGDRKTEDALTRIRKQAQQLDRNAYAAPDEEIKLSNPMEEDFCIFATSGYSLAESYRKAFDRPDDKKATAAAQQLARVPRIMLRIQEILDQRRSNLVSEAERIRALISERLELEATTAKEGSTRLKALELLGKQPHVGAFEDRQRVIDEKSSTDDIRDELTKRLAKLGGGK